MNDGMWIGLLVVLFWNFGDNAFDLYDVMYTHFGGNYGG